MDGIQLQKISSRFREIGIHFLFLSYDVLERMINMKNTKEQQIKEVLKLMNETLDNNEWKELLKIYLELKS